MLKGGSRNLFLTGDLGSGKTTFLKGLASGLGIDEKEVLSPTFQILRRYRGRDTELVHIDLYRISDKREILHLGWNDILSGESVTAVEWADRAAPILPDEGLFINFGYISGSRRIIRVSQVKGDASGS